MEQSENTSEKIPESLELARELENTDDETVIKEKLGLLLDTMSVELGSKYVENIAEIYKGMRSENCLARVERLSRVLETVELKTPLHISDEDETHYANAVIPLPEGIKIAFSEGQAPGPVRAVVGFGKTIIGFKTENLSVSEIDFEGNNFQNHGERKFLCRHVSGDLNKDDIRYIVIRIPTNLMPETHLSEEEKTKKLPFIFRGLQL